MIAEGQKGWIAAILETKGKLRKIARSGGSHQFTMRVNSTDPGPIIVLTGLTGVGVQEPKIEETFLRKGCIEHCPEDHVHVQVPGGSTLRWELSGVPLAIVLDNCMEHFQYSRTSMQELSSELWTLALKGGRGSAAIDRAVSRLRNLGWDLRTYDEEMSHAHPKDTRQRARNFQAMPAGLVVEQPRRARAKV